MDVDYGGITSNGENEWISIMKSVTRPSTGSIVQLAETSSVTRVGIEHFEISLARGDTVNEDCRSLKLTH